MSSVAIVRRRLSGIILPLMILAGTAPLRAETVRGTADVNGVVMAIELRTDDGLGELRHRPAKGGGRWETITIYGPDQVLALLADTRLSFLWPALDRWAGVDLVPLRNAVLERTRHAWRQGRPAAPPASTGQGFVTPKVRALLQYTDALQMAGRDAEAAALLTAALDGMLDGLAHQSVLLNALAAVRLVMGDVDGANNLLREAIVQLISSPMALNLQVALASRLAELGQSQEALTMIDDARVQFNAWGEVAQGVPGATLQLDWIRACALHGLGRTAEADALMASVKVAAQPVQPKERVLVPARNHDLAVRADLCVRDEGALVDTLSRELAAPPIGSHAFLYIQPSYNPPLFDRPTFDRARGRVRPGPAWRTLPTRYSAALARWGER